MTTDNVWENRYQMGQTGWDRGETSANLLHWTETGLLIPCRILIPGCGNGYEVLTLAEKGFDVIAIDIASTPLKKLTKSLQTNKLTADLVLADFMTWQPEKKIDAIYEQTSLCALDPEHWQAYEQRLHNWLKPKGKLFAQFMQSEQEGGPPFHCDIDEMRILFSSQRWHWSEQHQTQVIHSSGKYEKLYCLEKLGQ